MNVPQAHAVCELREPQAVYEVRRK